MNLKRVSLCDRVVALRYSVLILPVIFAFLSASCTKESTLLGLGLVPPGDKIQTIYTDTITVYSSLIKLDSVASYGFVSGYCGSYLDPVFGLTTGNLITQFSPELSNHRFGTNPVADSVVMRIKYSALYGNRASTVNFKVYELNDKLFPTADSSKRWDTIPYYSNLDIQKYLGTQIGEFSYSPASHTDSIITINLNADYFGKKLVEIDTVTQDSIHLFHRYIKGICIVPDKATSTGDGYIIQASLYYTLFDLRVAYHNTALTNHDSSAYYYVFSSNYDARINTFSHDYSSSKFISSLIQPNILDTFAYIQSMSGVMTKLSFPGLHGLKKKPSDIIAINKAELIIPVEPDDTIHYKPAGLLQALHLLSNGNYTNTPDFTFFADSAYRGGNYDMYRRQYALTLNKHFEYSLSQQGYNPDLFLRANSSAQYPFPGRSILKNGTGPNRIKLKITYTKR